MEITEGNRIVGVNGASMRALSINHAAMKNPSGIAAALTWELRYAHDGHVSRFRTVLEYLHFSKVASTAGMVPCQ